MSTRAPPYVVCGARARQYSGKRGFPRAPNEKPWWAVPEVGSDSRETVRCYRGGVLYVMRQAERGVH
eukprot:5808531-Lingulodinium_polyedra.AAC.1